MLTMIEEGIGTGLPDPLEGESRPEVAEVAKSRSHLDLTKSH